MMLSNITVSTYLPYLLTVCVSVVLIFHLEREETGGRVGARGLRGGTSEPGGTRAANENSSAQSFLCSIVSVSLDREILCAWYW